MHCAWWCEGGAGWAESCWVRIQRPPWTSPSPFSFFIKYRLCFVSFLNVSVGQINLWSNVVEASGISPEMNLISCLQSDVQKLSLGAEIYLSCLSQAEMGVSAEMGRGSANSQSLPSAKKERWLKCWRWWGISPFPAFGKGTLTFPGATYNFLRTAQ